MAVAYQEQKPPHPVAFDVAYPERLSRILIFFKLILAIPQFIAIYLLQIALTLLTLLAWFAILFTGRYPKAFFEFTSGVLRWQANIIAYVALMRDEYPPFSWEPGDYALTLDIPLAERQSRIRLLTRWIALIPNQIVFLFVQIAWAFTTFMSFFMILFSGRYPRGLFKFAVGAIRWQMRIATYQYLLGDEYPPYSINANARPGHEAGSFLLGIPIIGAYIAAIVLIAVFADITGSTTHVDRQLLTSGGLAGERPDAAGSGVRITLTGYDDDALPVSGVRPRDSERAVSFSMTVKEYLFSTDDFETVRLRVRGCDGLYYTEARVVGMDPTGYRKGDRVPITAYFIVPKSAPICELQYRGRTNIVRFVFD